MKYCEDITKQWLGIKTNKENKVLIPKMGDVIKYKGKEYLIDNVHIKLDFKRGEDKFAKEIAKYTDKKIKLFPRFDAFKSTDSMIGKDYVDFKITISGTDKFIFNNINEANYIYLFKRK